MTNKRTVDVDALLIALKPLVQSVEICDKYAGTEILEWEDFQITINRLAVPYSNVLTDTNVGKLPEVEIVFDKDGWCWDMEKMPLNTNVLLVVEYGGCYEVTMGSQRERHHEIRYDIKYWCGCCSCNEVAWRPLPSPPNEKG